MKAQKRAGFLVPTFTPITSVKDLLRRVLPIYIGGVKWSKTLLLAKQTFPHIKNTVNTGRVKH